MTDTLYTIATEIAELSDQAMKEQYGKTTVSNDFLIDTLYEWLTGDNILGPIENYYDKLENITR